jgi:hypothetical protein
MTKCLRCGHPCEYNLFSSAVNCTNPECPFAGEVFKLMAEAERLLKEAGL